MIACSCTGALEATCGAGKPALLQCWLRESQARRGLLVELASGKTLAIRQPLAFAAIAPHLTAFRPRHSSNGSSRRPARRGTTACYQFDALGGAAHFAALSMPETYDDQDEVGTGLYVLIGCAAVTVVLMYSWIGYTLYQGFKARRKVD